MTYSDGTTLAPTSGVTFVSSNLAVAGVGPTGVVTSAAPGTASIVATIGAVQSNASVVTVLDAVCVPPPADLVSWWPGEGHANDVVIANDASGSNVTFAPGRVGTAFRFGPGGFVDIPMSTSLMNQQFTLEAWVNADAATPVSDAWGQRIVGQDVDDVTGVGLYWRAIDNRFVFLFGNIVTDVLVSARAFAAGEFHHVAASYDGTTFRLFVDGTLEGELSRTKTIPYSSLPLTIGSTSSTYRALGFGRSWHGLIDEVAVYRRALSQAEIQSTVDAASAGMCAVPRVRSLML